MSSTAIALFFLGIVMLVAGADALVRGASRLAALLGISPLVIGLTVVALGTGSPEMVVGVRAALAGQGDIAVGNSVGASILNVLLVLGIAAVITPLVVSQRLVCLDVPVMIGAGTLLLLLSLDGTLSRGDGALLVAAMVAYTIFSVHQGRRDGRLAAEGYPGPVKHAVKSARGHWASQLGLVVLGLALLLTGASLLIDAAASLARTLGVSELVMSLAIVAIGTTLPETTTSILASMRGKADMAVGNVVGSNIINNLGVLGVASLASPTGLTMPTAALRFDIPVMLGVMVACLPLFFIGNRISRWEGALFLGFYGAYLAHLFLRATSHTALAGFGRAMVIFVIPLTLLTLGILTVRTVRMSRGEAGRVE